MSMVEKIRAVEEAALRPLINTSGCVYFMGLSEAIAAALAEAEKVDEVVVFQANALGHWMGKDKERDAAFQRAREAWAATVVMLEDDEATVRIDILDQFFGGGEGAG